MASSQTRTPGWMILLYVLFAVCVIALLWLVLTGIGVLPSGPAPAAGTPEVSGRQNLGAWPQTVVVFIATVVLGAAIAWGQYRSRNLPRATWEAGEAGSHELYKDGR